MAVLICYWTGTGNTQIMAEAMSRGLASVGIDVALKSVERVSVDEIDQYDKFMFGCPSMGIETLEEDEFEPFFYAIEAKLSGKKVALFGSYGWGEGEWMDEWEERVINLDAKLFERGMKINSTPSSNEVEQCFDFAVRFASF